MRGCTKYALVLAAVLALAGCPPRLSHNVKRTEDLVYGAGHVWDARVETYRLAELLFDLLEPTDIPAENRPAICMVHGGSFEGGSRKDEDLLLFADALASRGYVCFLIDYRVLGNNPPPAPEDLQLVDLGGFRLGIEDAVRAAFVDTKTALRHIRAFAADYGVDPERIAVFGESAGAFAAIAAGVTDPDAFADDGPGFDVPPENNPGVDPRPGAVLDFWGSARPVLDDFDAADPPILVVHGTSDTQLGTFYTEALAIINRCDDVGIPRRIHSLLGEGHGAWDAAWNKKPLWLLAYEFLEDYL